MKINTDEIIKNYEVQRNHLDRTDRCHAIRHSISLLMTEILRVSKLPYSSWRDKERIKSLDQQIQYLEEVLAAYERDMKLYE